LKQIWDEHKNDIPSINSIALEIGNNILKWIDNLEERSSLEVGSGTGIISALLVSYGFKVTLLDISETAIKISKNVFIKNKLMVILFWATCGGQKSLVNGNLVPKFR